MPDACLRTRQLSASRLDSEVSEFEVALVEAHLARCDSCRSFAEDLQGMTAALRAAPLESPSVSFRLPRRQRHVLALPMQVATVAAGIAAITFASLVGFHSPSTHASSTAIHNAREQLSIKERLLESLNTAQSSTNAREIQPGLAGAEHITVGTQPFAPKPGTAPSQRRGG